MLPIHCLLPELLGLTPHTLTKAITITPACQVENASSHPSFKAAVECKVSFLLTSCVYKVLHKSQTKKRSGKLTVSREENTGFSFIFHLLRLTSDTTADWNRCLTEVTKSSRQVKIYYFSRTRNFQTVVSTRSSCHQRDLLPKENKALQK